MSPTFTLIFDRMAGSLRENNVGVNAKRSILAGLIEEFINAGWDDAPASLLRFSEDRAVVRAFEDNDIFLAEVSEDY